MRTEFTEEKKKSKKKKKKTTKVRKDAEEYVGKWKETSVAQLS